MILSSKTIPYMVTIVVSILSTLVFADSRRKAPSIEPKQLQMLKLQIDPKSFTQETGQSEKTGSGSITILLTNNGKKPIHFPDFGSELNCQYIFKVEVREVVDVERGVYFPVILDITPYSVKAAHSFEVVKLLPNTSWKTELKFDRFLNAQTQKALAGRILDMRIIWDDAPTADIGNAKRLDIKSELSSDWMRFNYRP